MSNSWTIKERARLAWATCLEIVYPRTCTGCGKLLQDSQYSYLCGACHREIDWIKDPSCCHCGGQLYGKYATPATCGFCNRSTLIVDQCKSLFLYRGMGARLIHCLKYEGGNWLFEQIRELMADNAVLLEYFEDSLLVPIPLHRWKLKRRGYNQAEVIAAAIVSSCNQARMLPLLKRKKNTRSQTLLSRKQRLNNLKDAFTCRKYDIHSGKILLVDDVMTTGATLNAAAIALRTLVPNEISAFTLAHG